MRTRGEFHAFLLLEDITIETVVNKVILYKSSLREGVKHLTKIKEYVDFFKVNMILYFSTAIKLAKLFFEN